jgi:DNA-binding NarL/FixJ family response regulator
MAGEGKVSGGGGKAESEIHEANQNTIRIVLIDDQEEVRELLGAMLSMQPGFEIVGLASSGYEGIMLTERTKPDIVLTDLRMPGINGIQTTQEIVRRCAACRPRILLMTAYDDDEYVLEAIEAGASGYLLKNTELEDIANAIRLVHSDGSPQFAEKLGHRILARLKLTGMQIGENSSILLTERDYKIVQFLASGASNDEIAQKLGLSLTEIVNHIESLSAQVSLPNRVELVEWCKKFMVRSI